MRLHWHLSCYYVCELSELNNFTNVCLTLLKIFKDKERTNIMLLVSADMSAWFFVMRAFLVMLQISIDTTNLYTSQKTWSMTVSKIIVYEKKTMILLSWIIWKSIYVNIMKRRHSNMICQSSNKYHCWNFIII